MDPLANNVPAAHSADTTWYAVDADGVVGEFDTGEAGALPEAGTFYHLESDDPFDAFPLRALRVARLAARGALDPPPNADDEPARLVIVESAAELVEEAAEGYRAGETTSTRIARELEPFDPWVVREEDPRVLATAKALPANDWKRIAALPGVTHAITEDALWIVFEETTSADGMFRFENEDYGVPGAYVRRVVPDEPLRAEELPEATREQVRTVSLPVHFAEASSLQLADYFANDELPSWNNQIDARGQPRQRPAAATEPGQMRAVLVLLVVAVVLAVIWVLTRSL